MMVMAIMEMTKMKNSMIMMTMMIRIKRIIMRMRRK